MCSRVRPLTQARRQQEANEQARREWSRNARHEEDKRREEERRRRHATSAHEHELDEIKAQYLGKPKEKKKALKPADKFKFLFDWEPVRCFGVSQALS